MLFSGKTNYLKCTGDKGFPLLISNYTSIDNVLKNFSYINIGFYYKLNIDKSFNNTFISYIKVLFLNYVWRSRIVIYVVISHKLNKIPSPNYFLL